MHLFRVKREFARELLCYGIRMHCLCTKHETYQQIEMGRTATRVTSRLPQLDVLIMQSDLQLPLRLRKRSRGTLKAVRCASIQLAGNDTGS